MGEKTTVIRQLYVGIETTFIQKLGQSINHSMRTRKSGKYQNGIHHPEVQVQLSSFNRCTRFVAR